MGLFRRKIKNGVAGSAQVVSCSMHGSDGAYQNCRMQLVVHVEGWQPYPAEVHQIVSRKKWPQPGITLPVLVSRGDPHKLKIDFDQVPTNRDRARQIAEQQAQSMGSPAGFPPPGSDQPQVQIIGDPSSLPPEKLDRVERMLGLDLDGDGRVGSPATTSPSGGSDDRLARLERLAALHASGALTDAEFAAEKARILGG